MLGARQALRRPLRQRLGDPRTARAVLDAQILERLFCTSGHTVGMHNSPHLDASTDRQGAHGGFVEDNAGWIAATSAGLGIIGLFALPVVASIAAIVLGYMSRRAIDRTGRNLDKRSWATAGIWTGWIGTLLGVIIVLLFLFGIIGAFSLLM